MGRPLRRLLLLMGLGSAGALLLALAVLCGTAGCSSMGYLAQAAGGHLDLLRRARPVAEAEADPATPAAVKARLARARQMRDFAVAELALPDNDSYRRYADLGRESVLWNVVAAPELGLTLKTWCYPVTGCVGYRGLFDRAAAEAEAAALRAEGWDVHVYGVPAYSTLGWSNWVGGDPLLNTFITWPEPALAQLIFHELAHQVAYAANDTTFNESYATAVERLGGARWMAAQASEAQRAQQALSERRRADFRELTRQAQADLRAVYAAAGDDSARRAGKARVLAELRARHEALKAGPWAGFSGYDAWIAQANNASLGVLAAYNALVPDFEALFERCGQRFSAFHAEVQRLARPAAPAERLAALRAAPCTPHDPASAP